MKKMTAMILKSQANINTKPLERNFLPIPEPKEKEVLIKVNACAICRTDLHIIEGDIKPSKLPLILGHQAVGEVVATSSCCERFKGGEFVGVAWLGGTCGACHYCMNNNENLCERSVYTGYDRDGGFAEYLVSHEDYIYQLSKSVEPFKIAPLLCGGIIGYRAFKLTGAKKGDSIGLVGFGSSAHIVLQIAKSRQMKVFVISRRINHQNLAKKLGADWVNESFEKIPVKLDSVIIFAPLGALVPLALKSVRKGGTVVTAGIHMSFIPEMVYEECLFYEKRLLSTTANTREDGIMLLKEAFSIPITLNVSTYPLTSANEALLDLKSDNINGSGVLVP